MISDEQLSAFVALLNETANPDTPYDATTAVNWLQRALEMPSTTGVYDSATMDAVKAFQSENALEATGLVDAATLGLLLPTVAA